MSDEGEWVIRPCTVCGIEIEDLDTGQDWICTQCWPEVKFKRMEARALAAEAALAEIAQPQSSRDGNDPHDLGWTRGWNAAAEVARRALEVSRG